LKYLFAVDIYQSSVKHWFFATKSMTNRATYWH
jgi:hypothetical protein